MDMAILWRALWPLWQPTNHRCLLCRDAYGVDDYYGGGERHEGFGPADRLARHNRLFNNLCPGCLGDLPRITAACARCGLPLAQPAATCGHCTATPPQFSHCYCPYEYGYPIDYLIQQYKHHRRFAAGKLMQQLLVSHTRHLPWHQWQGLVPVPLHWRKLWRRGFNQAFGIAEALAHQHQLPIYHAQRTRPTPSQQGLNRKQRLKNLTGAFAVAPEVNGKAILIIDDVITTGATADCLTEALLKAGATSVDVLALARTPKP